MKKINLLLGSSIAQLSWDLGATEPSNDTLQWDFIIAGRQYIGENNYFTYNCSYGNASGKNIIAFAGSKANAVLNTEGKLDPMLSKAIMFRFIHRWAPKIESNITYAFGWLGDPASRAPFALKRVGIGYLILIYKFDERFSIGAEYIWGAQRTSNDSYGAANRIQTITKF